MEKVVVSSVLQGLYAIYLSWEPQEDAYGKAMDVKLLIRSGLAWQTVTISPPDNAFFILDLEPNTTVSVCLRVVNKFGQEGPSTCLKATTISGRYLLH